MHHEPPMSQPNESTTDTGIDPTRVAPHAPLDEYYEREANRHSSSTWGCATAASPCAEPVSLRG